MSINLTVNGVTFAYPTNQQTAGWGTDATNWASAITNGMLSKAGGTFTLTSEVDFGTGYGVKSLYYKTRAANIAQAGQFRLAQADVISWRNAANTNNLNLGPGSDNLIEFNGVDLVDLSTTQTLTNKTVNTVTPTEMAYVSGVTSSIQNQLNATVPISKGGSGQTAANAALNAFLPSQATHTGKVLSSDGTNTSWISAFTTNSDTVTVGQGLAANNAILTINGGADTGKGAYIKFSKTGTAHNYIGHESAVVGGNTSNNLVLWSEAGNSIKFFTNGSATSRATIDTAGNVLIGKTTTSFGAVGIELRADNSVYITNTTGTTGLSMNRLSSDGSLIDFHRDGAVVGSISVASGVVTYGSFAGKHWSQLSDKSNPDIKMGTVVSTIDEMCEWTNETNLQLAKFEVSRTLNDPAVYGVFLNWDEGGDADIVSLGAFVCRVTGPCKSGDLLTSAGDGTAKVQADDIIRSSTIGKVTKGFKNALPEEENLVPCVLYCG